MCYMISLELGPLITISLSLSLVLSPHSRLCNMSVSPGRKFCKTPAVKRMAPADGVPIQRRRSLECGVGQNESRGRVRCRQSGMFFHLSKSQCFSPQLIFSTMITRPFIFCFNFIFHRRSSFRSVPTSERSPTGTPAFIRTSCQS